MWGQKRPRKRASGTKIEWTSRPDLAALPPKRNALRASFNDPQVEAGLKNGPRPVIYRPDTFISPETQKRLVNGAGFIAARDLCAGERGVYPYVPLVLSMVPPEGTVLVPRGSLLMYAGSVRSVERKWVQSALREVDVQVTKHTFITPFGRCIIHDLNLVIAV